MCESSPGRVTDLLYFCKGARGSEQVASTQSKLICGALQKVVKAVLVNKTDKVLAALIGGLDVKEAILSPPLRPFVRSLGLLSSHLCGAAVLEASELESALEELRENSQAESINNSCKLVGGVVTGKGFWKILAGAQKAIGELKVDATAEQTAQELTEFKSRIQPLRPFLLLLSIIAISILEVFGNVGDWAKSHGNLSWDLYDQMVCPQYDLFLGLAGALALAIVFPGWKHFLVTMSGI